MSLTLDLRRIAALGAGVCLAVLLSACGGLRHIPGSSSLRGGQPTTDEIAWAVREHGIRTVISLRSRAEHTEWYRAEVEVCRRLGIEHVSLGWSARGTSDEKVDALVELLERCEHPVFIHCRNGHDRSSLASAVYRSVVLGHSDEDASGELSFVPYGHVPLFGYEAMDEAWARFVARRKQPRRVEAATGEQR